MEACGGSHFLGRALRGQGHEVRLMPAQYVKAFVKTNKNDFIDAGAIAEAVSRPTMRFVPIGGRRHARNDSPNLGWRNASFRGFADYMSTKEFLEGVEELIEIANARETAIMCAEAVPWRCHRSLIGDALTEKVWIVRDILSRTVAAIHPLTPFLQIREGLLIYPEES